MSGASLELGHSLTAQEYGTPNYVGYLFSNGLDKDKWAELSVCVYMTRAHRPILVTLGGKDHKTIIFQIIFFFYKKEEENGSN